MRQPLVLGYNTPLAISSTFRSSWSFLSRPFSLLLLVANHLALSAVPSSAYTTFVGSTHSRASSASDHTDAATATCTYNIDRLNRQDSYNASTIYGRVLSGPSDPHPTARVQFYTTRAAVAIGAFDASFETSSLS